MDSGACGQITLLLTSCVIGHLWPQVLLKVSTGVLGILLGGVLAYRIGDLCINTQWQQIPTKK